MKVLFTTSLLFLSLLALASCGNSENDDAIVFEPDSFKQFKKLPPATTGPTTDSTTYSPIPPKSSRTSPNLPGSHLEDLVKEEVGQRAPELIDSIFKNHEDAELMAEVIEQAPQALEKILARSEKEGKSPVEIIGKELLTMIIEEKTADIQIPSELGKDLPEAIDKIQRSAENGTLLEIIGSAVLNELLEDDERKF